jgi:hypothetical protein
VEAIGIDPQGNICTVSGAPSAFVECKTDQLGDASCDVMTAPMKGTYCPAGDRCELKGPNAADPMSTPYSDMSAFIRTGGCRPVGDYTRIVHGCAQPGTTRWNFLSWTSDEPLNTLIRVELRGGTTPTPDMTWTMWTSYLPSPIDLSLATHDALMGTDYIQIDFEFVTQDSAVVPTLKSYDVTFECAQH